jgi:hypothetical protein
MQDQTLQYVDVTILVDAHYPQNTDDVTVAIGDGRTKFDESFDFDPRVYFYFDDQAAFDRSRREEVEEVGFQIVKVLTPEAPTPVATTPVSQRLRIGGVGVDSGQIMVGDPCYLSDWKDNDFSDQAVANRAQTYDYAGACAQTLSPRRAGMLDQGRAVVSSTGYGDGFYPVYATYNEDGIIVKLEVVFVSDEDEEEED